MKKISLALVVVFAFFITAHQAGAESWFSKTFGPNGTAFKMLGASVMNITTIDSVQKKLIETGTFAGPVTGAADAQTVEAVKTFQAANNLKVDGVVGRETLKVLDPGALAGMASSTQPVPVDKWKVLCATLQGQTPQPYIEVISPNGGETYTAGQQITVKWKSCNLPTSTSLQILLEEMNPNGTGQGYGLVAYGTPNDGVQDVNLFSAAQWNQVSGGSQMQFGTKYRVKIMVTNNSGVVDTSNNLFTITDGATSSASSSPILLRPIDARSGYNFSQNVNAGALTLNYLFAVKNTSSQPVWIQCNVLSPQLNFTANPFGIVAASRQCASSVGDLNADVVLNPNQEIYVSQVMAFPVNQAPQFVSAQFQGTAKFIYYKLSPTANSYQEVDPSLNPQYQPSWDALLNTPWMNY